MVNNGKINIQTPSKKKKRRYDIGDYEKIRILSKANSTLWNGLLVDIRNGFY